MEFLSTNNILDFENGFISNKREVIYSDACLSHEDFQKCLRVFYWFAQEYDFEDLREVCEKTIMLMNDDPLKLGLLHFLKAYVNRGDLDCTAFTGGISNNIPQTIRALSNTYKALMKESSPDLDLSIFTELEAKFHSIRECKEPSLELHWRKRIYTLR